MNDEHGVNKVHRHRLAIEPSGMKSDSPNVYEVGRKCSVRGCKTILSIYNDGERCNAHKRTLNG